MHTQGRFFKDFKNELSLTRKYCARIYNNTSLTNSEVFDSGNIIIIL